MQILTFISNFLVEAAAYNEYFRSGMAYIGAAIAVFTGIGAALGEGSVAAKAVEAIGRQPEALVRLQLRCLLDRLFLKQQVYMDL